MIGCLGIKLNEGKRRPHVGAGRGEVEDVELDGDLDEALGGHDGRRPHVVHQRRDRPGLPIPLPVLRGDGFIRSRLVLGRAILGS